MAPDVTTMQLWSNRASPRITHYHVRNTHHYVSRITKIAHYTWSLFVTTSNRQFSSGGELEDTMTKMSVLIVSNIVISRNKCNVESDVYLFKKCRRQHIVKWQKMNLSQTKFCTLSKLESNIIHKLGFLNFRFCLFICKMLWPTKLLTPSSGKKNSTVAKTTIDGASR